MKILYLVPHVPSLTKVRSYNHILGLANAGHKLTIATLSRSTADLSNVEKLRQAGFSVIVEPVGRTQIGLNAVSVLPSTRPLQSAVMWSPTLMRRIEQQLHADPPDVIHVEHLRMARYGLRLRSKAPTVWDAVDQLTGLFQQTATQSASLVWRLLARIEASRLSAYEHWLTSQFPKTLVITKRDQQLFQHDNPYADRVLVAPAGLVPPSLSMEPRASDTLVITGTLNYQPNIASILYFVEQIFPLIQERQPGVRLRLVGANPVPKIQALANSQIEITGFVPSIHEALQQATIALAPILYGAGLQYKVLEAFFAQTPVVATSTAAQGYEIRNNEQLLIADQPLAFAEAVIRLLNDADLRQQVGAAGRRYAEQNHDISVTTAHLIEIYQDVIHAQQDLAD
ncbi:MAG: glycosyltransferase family 4 protein [Aggregatilineales bacterium]